MRLILLHNPSAGEEDHGRDELEAMLGEAGHEVVYASLEEEDWTDVLGDSVDLIVVAGGDGSVRQLFTAIGSFPTPVALVPVGSANNIARTLGLDEGRALSLLAEREPAARRRFDLWEVTSTVGTSRCVEAVGGGMFAELLDRAEDAPAEPSGSDKVDFGLHLLAHALRSAEPRRWTLEIDGDRVEEELLGVEAMNIRELGANLLFAPAADCGDGLLDLVVIRPDDRDELARYVDARLRDEDHPGPSLEGRRVSQLVLEPPKGVRLHVDDVLPAWDEGTTSWVEIAPAETHVEVLVPARQMQGTRP